MGWLKILIVLIVIIILIVASIVVYADFVSKKIIGMVEDQIMAQGSILDVQDAFDEFEENYDYPDIVQDIDTGIKNNEMIAKLLNTDKYRLKDGVVEIYPSLQSTTIKPTEEVYVEGMTSKMEVGQYNGQKALVIQDRIATISIMLIPAVLVDQEFMYQGNRVYQLNPHIYVNKKVNENNFNLVHIKQKCVAEITTITTDGRFLKISAEVTRHINIPIMFKNKPKIGTIGLIIPMIEDTDCIWVGSPVYCSKMVYVVIEVIKYSAPDVIKLLCMAPIATTTHIKVIQKDES